MLKLQLCQKPQTFVKLSFATVTLGRDESNHLVLDDPSVSDFHAEVICEDHRYYIVDLMSASGTFVNERRISERAELKSWDRIRLGNVELEVSDPNQCRPGDWALRSASNDFGNQFYRLDAESVIGRSAECDISIDSNLLSRRHARLIIEEDCLRVVDLQSANGTFINDTRVEEAKAYPGDELRFDQQRFILLGPSQTQLQREPEDDGRTQLRTVESMTGTSAAATDNERPPEAPSPAPVSSKPNAHSPGLRVLAGARAAQGLKATPGAGHPPSPPSPLSDDAPKPVSPGAVSSANHNAFAPSPPAVDQPAPGPDDETQFLGSINNLASPLTPPPIARLVDRSASPAQEWELQPRAYLLGRGDDNDIVLSDRSVSKVHAKLQFIDGSWSIENRGARNGVKINGALVDNARLQSGDEIELGRARLAFSAENAAAEDPMVTVYYQAPEQDADITRPVPEERRPNRQRAPAAWHGVTLLLLGLVAAVVIYLWRKGLLDSVVTELITRVRELVSMFN